jgi:GNAT superfamily N-acetyltransferase
VILTEDLLDAFYDGIYLGAFADRREPREVWKRRLWGGTPGPYELTVELAGEHLDDPARRDIHAGVVFERYPASGCGLVTYLVVAPAQRGRGLGRRLLTGAVERLAAPLVLGEVGDPASLAQFLRWGARVLDVRYVQPALGPGLARDRSLQLVALPGAAPLPDTVPGARVAAFLAELYAVTEGTPPAGPDDELRALLAAIPETVRLSPSAAPRTPSAPSGCPSSSRRSGADR